MDRLVEHFPELRKGRLIIVLIGVGAFAATTVVLLTVDVIRPGWTALGQMVALGFVYVWTGQFYWRRESYRARWGELAFRNAYVRHVVVGVGALAAAVAHNAYMPGERIVPGWAEPVALGLGIYLLVIGVTLWLRSVFTFGIDKLTNLYVYFPEDSQIVSSSVYSIIRHPVYSGALHVILGLGLLRGTWFSIAFGILMPGAMAIWLKTAEEPELVERLGNDYVVYRNSVPAFFPRPRDWGRVLRFVMRGK